MWLLLVHQVPPDPAYLRVKVRRRLRRIGAAALKNTVYVLPSSEANREDFEWLAREIRTEGGDAFLWESRLLGGMTDEGVRNLFRAEREVEYAEIARELDQIATGVPIEGAGGALERARRKFESATRLDFFDALGRVRVERALAEAEARLAGGAATDTQSERPSLEELSGRVWVTRRGVHVDRMASAWLVRRFIDPEARFRFVDPDGYEPEAEEIRFDMFEAEFTHDGDRCTFEVLSALVGPEDPSLQALAEIVHDIDLNDGKFGRVESAGIERLIAGIQKAHPADADRLDRAAEMFEGLYLSFGADR